MRSPVADLLADLARACDALGISWYPFGAQAAIVYGVARLTADDVVTLLRTHGNGIDATRVRAVLTLLEQALGQSDLPGAFEQCRTRART